MPKRRAEHPHWACGKCSYDLSGCLDAERCPECGTAIAGINDDELGPNLVDLNELPDHIRVRAEAGVRGDSTVAGKPKLCAQCGYDLAGVTGRCPECGLPIREKLGRAMDDNLVSAPLAYLKKFRLAMLGMALAAIALPIAMVMVMRKPAAEYIAASIALALIWAGSTCLATIPRPGHNASEMKLTRSLARWSQVSWIGVSMMLAVSMTATGMSSNIAAGVALVLSIVGLAGFSPVAEYLGMLADWAGAGSYATGLRASSIAIILFGVLTASCVPLAFVPGLGVLVLLMPFFFLFFWIAVLSFLIALIKLAITGSYAVGNAKAMHARDTRLAERRREHAERMVSRQTEAPSFGDPTFEADLAPLDPGPWRPPEEEQRANKADDEDPPPIPLA